MNPHPVNSDPTGRPDHASLEQLRASWTEAERRLYPLATTVPQKYELVIRLARQVANDLTAVETSQDLATRWNDGPAMVAAAAEQLDLPLADLPPEQVAGVAFSLRDNELKSLEHSRNQQQLITDARERSEAWVLLHETGTLKHGLLDPYSAIELHLQSGVAIVSSVEPNPMTAAANHVLTVIRMDPETGSPTDIDPGIAETQEHPDAQAFLASRQALHQLVETL